MLSVLLVALVIAAASAIPTWEKLDGYTFEQYVKDFDMRFKAGELSQRKAIFEAELARVRAHNAKNLSWKESVSKFSAMSDVEKKAYFGRSKSLSGHLKKNALKSGNNLPADFELKPISQLPKHVDWREAGIVTPVKDQGHCGSCWSFAATATIESHVAKASGLLFDLSVQQVAMCTPNPNQCGGTGGCNGATSELAFEYVTNSNGLYQEFQYGYDSYYGQNYNCSIPSSAPVATINGFVKLPENSYLALMNAVATVGPIAVSVDASSWHQYSSGIFDGCNQQTPDVNHAVILMGYGEENGQKYWLVRNSWSPKWGEKGYIRIARSDAEQDRCGMDVTPQHGSACAGEEDPVKACGTCAILYDSSFPLNPRVL